MQELKNEIKELMLTGKKWTREDLRSRTFASDRLIRLAIKELRDVDHVPICSSSNSKGYHLAKSADEYLANREREVGSRVNDGLKSLEESKATAYEWPFGEVAQ